METPQRMWSVLQVCMVDDDAVGEPNDCKQHGKQFLG